MTGFEPVTCAASLLQTLHNTNTATGAVGAVAGVCCDLSAAFETSKKCHVDALRSKYTCLSLVGSVMNCLYHAHSDSVKSFTF